MGNKAAADNQSKEVEIKLSESKNLPSPRKGLDENPINSTSNNHIDKGTPKIQVNLENKESSELRSVSQTETSVKKSPYTENQGVIYSRPYRNSNATMRESQKKPTTVQNETSVLGLQDQNNAESIVISLNDQGIIKGK